MISQRVAGNTLAFRNDGTILLFKSEGWLELNAVLKHRTVGEDFEPWCADHGVKIDYVFPEIYQIVCPDENAAFEFKLRWM